MASEFTTKINAHLEQHRWTWHTYNEVAKALNMPSKWKEVSTCLNHLAADSDSKVTKHPQKSGLFRWCAVPFDGQTKEVRLGALIFNIWLMVKDIPNMSGAEIARRTKELRGTVDRNDVFLAIKILTDHQFIDRSGIPVKGSKTFRVVNQIEKTTIINAVKSCLNENNNAVWMLSENQQMLSDNLSEMLSEAV